MNPNLNAFLTQLKLFLVLVGGLMAEQGYDHTTAYKWVMLASGSCIALGSSAWALWASFANWRKAAAVGVAAGINLTVAGKAVTDDGKVISQFATPDATPPKPVTVETAAQIVKDFAPATPPAKA